MKWSGIDNAEINQMNEPTIAAREPVVAADGLDPFAFHDFMVAALDPPHNSSSSTI
jgi:hypothetical protein